MIDRRLVRDKLESCNRYLERLRPSVDAPFRTFSADPLLFSSAERQVQLLVDTAVDVNNHLLMEAGRPPARDYRSSFTELAPIGVLKSPLASALARTAGLRNLLVHGYDAVDLRRLHRQLRPIMRDFKKYVAAVRRYARV